MTSALQKTTTEGPTRVLLELFSPEGFWEL